ncbi:MAG: RdgB/HAM1 family non-canonical purine NTP pyrophosphatase [Bacteroidales bacterium]|nr:RdgB/HAM1 family non-canonical purine NTP pyrophosphatase [Bacteroidales bacterium]
MEIIFATGNAHKVTEAQKALGNGVTLIMPKKLGITEDIPETGTTLEANAIQKCQYLWERLHKACFADDTGLEVEALDGGPGVHTARYAGESKDPGANMDKLLYELDGKRNRKARFRTAVAYIDNNGEQHLFEGVLEGEIAHTRSGSEGFGYDPVFIPYGYGGKTLAEISLEEKNAISHRGKAMRALMEFLIGNIN